MLAELNQQTKDGRGALSNIHFFGDQSQFSIGYRTVRATEEGGLRHLHEVCLYEVSPVLHGAHRLTGVLGAKTGRPAGLETKSTPTTVRGPHGGLGGRAARLERCGVCGTAAGLANRSTVGMSTICAACVDEVPRILDDLGALDPTPAEVYEQAASGERVAHTDPDGTLRPGPRDRRWRP